MQRRLQVQLTLLNSFPPHLLPQKVAKAPHPLDGLMSCSASFASPSVMFLCGEEKYNLIVTLFLYLSTTSTLLSKFDILNALSLNCSYESVDDKINDVSSLMIAKG